MHTDEYEISLLREVNVCRREIASLQASLMIMEKKYGTSSDSFEKQYGSTPRGAENRDFAAWFAACEALRAWESRQLEYENAYRSMKI